MKRIQRADDAIIELIGDGVERYGILRKPASQIDDVEVAEVFELTLDVIGGGAGHKETMRMMPKEKKLTLF